MVAPYIPLNQGVLFAIILDSLVQHSVCHERQFKVDPFWQTQPVKYRESVRHVVIATKSKYQASCGVEYGLQTSLEICRKSDSDKHEVAVIEPRLDERDHERTKADLASK